MMVRDFGTNRVSIEYSMIIDGVEWNDVRRSNAETTNLDQNHSNN